MESVLGASQAFDLLVGAGRGWPVEGLRMEYGEPSSRLWPGHLGVPDLY